MSHGCDVVRPWEQEAVVLSVLPCGQIVANACHHDADIGESGSIGGLLHIAVDTYMNLKDNRKVKVILRNWGKAALNASGSICHLKKEQ